MNKVDDLDPSMVLAAATATEHEARIVELRRLELAVHWCVLHPATADTGVATHNPDTTLPGVLGLDEPLGGDGTPTVAAFTPEPFAAAMGMSPAAGAQLLADALDLTHRLPRLWRRVQDLEIPAWQARRAAQHTHQLSLEAARWVDDRLDDRAGCGPITVDRLVADAIARFDPEEHERREDKGKASWDVELVHPNPTEFTGTSELHARGDTLDLAKFYDLVCDTAAQLKTLGDPDDLGARKAKALGVLADLACGQAAFDLAALVPTRRAGKVRLYVNVDADDLDTDRATVGDVERLGPATIAKIKDWVGHSQVTIQPVLDMGRGDAVHDHDPPAWMREIVITPRPALRVPPLPGRRPLLRPGPHRPLPRPRRRRTTRPNQPSKPRLPLQTTPPSQDRRRLAIPTRPQPGRLPLAWPIRCRVPRRPHRHHHPARQLAGGTAVHGWWLVRARSAAERISHSGACGVLGIRRLALCPTHSDA